MIILVLGLGMFGISQFIKNDKFAGIVGGIGGIIICVSLLSVFFVNDTNYADCSLKQLEEKTIKKSTMQVSNLKLKLVETESGNKYKGTYFGDGVTRPINEQENCVKMVKSDKTYAYIDKRKVKENVTSYIFSFGYVMKKIINGEEIVYVIHYI